MNIRATYTVLAHALSEISGWNILIVIYQIWWLHLPAISGYNAFHFRLCRYV